MLNPPLKLAIMLACYYAADPIDAIGHHVWNSPGGLRFVNQLKADGLINDDHQATPRGRLWVEILCNLPPLKI